MVVQADGCTEVVNLSTVTSMPFGVPFLSLVERFPLLTFKKDGSRKVMQLNDRGTNQQTVQRHLLWDDTNAERTRTQKTMES